VSIMIEDSHTKCIHESDSQETTSTNYNIFRYILIIKLQH